MTHKVHAEILARLLPPVAYDVDAAGVAAELAALASVLDDALHATDTLAAEADPRAAYDLLEEWEAAYGLPDECVDEQAVTVAVRRLAVAAKVAERGGQTAAYFEAVAVAFGYPDARVREYRPWTCTSPCDEPIAGTEWGAVWSIETAAVQRVTYWSCTDPCTDPLANWSFIEPLSCVMNRLKPAHTICYIDLGV